MEGDFKRPPRRPDGFAGGRPHPQASLRPAAVTDLRSQIPMGPAGPQPAIPRPASQQPPQYHHKPVPEPIASVQSQAPAQPAPTTTAELIARHEQATKPPSNTKRNLVLAVFALLVIITDVSLMHHVPIKYNGAFPSSVSAAQITIPVYLPKNLPLGFKVSGYKAVKQNLLNYVITNQNNDSFYVNIQPTTAGYDFNGFNKRFVSPNTYSTNIGTATAGIMNNQLVCSIVTGKSWVLINTTATKDTQDMATIAKALKPVSI